MTVHQKTALRVTGVLLATWLLLALAIADFPPPPGFVVLVLILLACALLVYLRVPVYLRWRAEGTRGRVLRVGRDGLLGSVVIGLLSLLSPWEPSIQPGLSDRLIGIGILIGLGVVNALAAYAWAHGCADEDPVEQRIAVTSSAAEYRSRSTHASAFLLSYLISLARIVPASGVRAFLPGLRTPFHV